MLNLKIILVSTRPGRQGPALADWIYGLAAQRPEWEVELLDLAKINLPMMDEAAHPRFKKYEHQHTKDWSAMIDPADAFIFVTPEYNFGYPAPIKNAIDYLYQEWQYKPVAFVAYGGISAGTRSIQMLKQVVTSLKMMPIPESVNVPFFARFIKEGRFEPDEATLNAAQGMLDELIRWAEVLKPMRKKEKVA